ncbi:Uncharacterized protein TCM_019964 [Theobroma cacao]|uniref:Uncharacterized protein n=1 Tax=Theobroma cacao TaxID=3641 RepID=A0A061ER61_THECC|nr:Uncharacterized protein TCM_019964 [Theobroma cacao]
MPVLVKKSVSLNSFPLFDLMHLIEQLNYFCTYVSKEGIIVETSDLFLIKNTQVNQEKSYTIVKKYLCSDKVETSQGPQMSA